MKKLAYITTIIIMGIFSVLSINSCTVSKKISAKDGGELWSENCGRCHLAPGKSSYSPAQWDAIGLHMRMRAQIPADETTKIIAFLKGEE